MQDVAVACRVLLGLVFLAAVVGKLSSRHAYGEFVGSLRDMHLLPECLVGPTAAASVAGEAAIVALLAVPVRSVAVSGFALAAGLLAVFGTAITLSLRRGNAKPCRCFGRSTTPLGWHHLWRNGLLGVAAAVGALASMSHPDAPVTVLALVAALAGAVLAAVIIMLDDLASLFKGSGQDA